MSNIMVQRKNGGEGSTMARTSLEPLRLMRDLLGWDPFQQMTPMWPTDAGTTFPAAFEVKETKDAFQFKADVPGVKESDVDVNLTGNRLTIAGRREAEKEDKTDTYYTYERSYGSFTRTFTLPEEADLQNVRAELKDGVLTVALPKKAAAVAKKIPIASGQTIKT
jgi:HSP20 family protein